MTCGTTQQWKTKLLTELSGKHTAFLFVFFICTYCFCRLPILAYVNNAIIHHPSCRLVHGNNAEHWRYCFLELHYAIMQWIWLEVNPHCIDAYAEVKWAMQVFCAKHKDKHYERSVHSHDCFTVLIYRWAHQCTDVSDGEVELHTLRVFLHTPEYGVVPDRSQSICIMLWTILTDQILCDVYFQKIFFIELVRQRMCLFIVW